MRGNFDDVADLLLDYGAVVETTTAVYEKLCEASLQEDVQVRYTPLPGIMVTHCQSERSMR